MRRRITWSDHALKNLLEIIDFIEKDSVSNASLYARRLLSSVERLKHFPLSGRMVPELRDQPNSPREVLIDDYRVLYVLKEYRIIVTNIFHGRRNLNKRMF